MNTKQFFLIFLSFLFFSQEQKVEILPERDNLRYQNSFCIINSFNIQKSESNKNKQTNVDDQQEENHEVQQIANIQNQKPGESLLTSKSLEDCSKYENQENRFEEKNITDIKEKRTESEIDFIEPVEPDAKKKILCIKKFYFWVVKKIIIFVFVFIFVFLLRNQIKKKIEDLVFLRTEKKEKKNIQETRIPQKEKPQTLRDTPAYEREIMTLIKFCEKEKPQTLREKLAYERKIMTLIKFCEKEKPQTLREILGCEDSSFERIEKKNKIKFDQILTKQKSIIIITEEKQEIFLHIIDGVAKKKITLKNFFTDISFPLVHGLQFHDYSHESLFTMFSSVCSVSNDKDTPHPCVFSGYYADYSGSSLNGKISEECLREKKIKEKEPENLKSFEFPENRRENSSLSQNLFNQNESEDLAKKKNDRSLVDNYSFNRGLDTPESLNFFSDIKTETESGNVMKKNKQVSIIEILPAISIKKKPINENNFDFNIQPVIQNRLELTHSNERKSSQQYEQTNQNLSLTNNTQKQTQDKVFQIEEGQEKTNKQKVFHSLNSIAMDVDHNPTESITDLGSCSTKTASRIGFDSMTLQSSRVESLKENKNKTQCLFWEAGSNNRRESSFFSLGSKTFNSNTFGSDKQQIFLDIGDEDNYSMIGSQHYGQKLEKTEKNPIKKTNVQKEIISHDQMPLHNKHDVENLKRYTDLYTTNGSGLTNQGNLEENSPCFYKEGVKNAPIKEDTNCMNNEKATVFSRKFLIVKEDIKKQFSLQSIIKTQTFLEYYTEIFVKFIKEKKNISISLERRSRFDKTKIIQTNIFCFFSEFLQTVFNYKNFTINNNLFLFFNDQPQQIKEHSQICQDVLIKEDEMFNLLTALEEQTRFMVTENNIFFFDKGKFYKKTLFKNICILKDTKNKTIAKLIQMYEESSFEFLNFIKLLKHQQKQKLESFFKKNSNFHITNIIEKCLLSEEDITDSISYLEKNRQELINFCNSQKAESLLGFETRKTINTSSIRGIKKIEKNFLIYSNCFVYLSNHDFGNVINVFDRANNSHWALRSNFFGLNYNINSDFSCYNDVLETIGEILNINTSVNKELMFLFLFKNIEKNFQKRIITAEQFLKHYTDIIFDQSISYKYPQYKRKLKINKSDLIIFLAENHIDLEENKIEYKEFCTKKLSFINEFLKELSIILLSEQKKESIEVYESTGSKKLMLRVKKNEQHGKDFTSCEKISEESLSNLLEELGDDVLFLFCQYSVFFFEKQQLYSLSKIDMQEQRYNENSLFLKKFLKKAEEQDIETDAFFDLLICQQKAKFLESIKKNAMNQESLTFYIKESLLNKEDITKFFEKRLTI